MRANDRATFAPTRECARDVFFFTSQVAFPLPLCHLYTITAAVALQEIMSGLSGSMRSSLASSSRRPGVFSGRPIVCGSYGQEACSTSKTPAHPASCFSTSTTRHRNTPVRRSRDPLDSSPDAIRHRLTTGETFIIRLPPTAPTPYNLGPSQTTVSYPSTSAAAAASSSSMALPPALPPTSKTRHKLGRTLSASEIEEIQALREQDPWKHTISTLAEKFQCSPSIVKIAAPLSAAKRRDKEAEVEARRDNWGANKTLQRALRRERKSLW